MCAIDISGRPLCVFEADLPPVTIAGFDNELAEEFFRAVAINVADDAPRRVALRLERAPHDRGVLQGVRPGAPRGRLDRPRRDRGALDEGHALTMPSRSATTAWATCARSRRRSRAWRRGRASPTPRARAGRGRPDPAGGRRVSRGDGAHPRAGLRRSSSRSGRGRRAGARDLPRACSSSSARRPSSAAARGSGCSRARSPSSTPGPEGPAHRLGAGHLDARVAADRGPRARGALLLRPLARLAPGDRADTLGTATYGETFAARSSATTSSASSSTRRSRARRACGCSRTSRRSSPVPA